MRPVLLWVWLGGAALCALVAATRIVRFERLLRDTLPASERLQRLASEIAGKLGVRRVPDVRYVEVRPCSLPLVRRPSPDDRLAAAAAAASSMTEAAALILAHELAHLRRRDHWVRALELFVSTVYWWNPAGVADSAADSRRPRTFVATRGSAGHSPIARNATPRSCSRRRSR